MKDLDSLKGLILENIKLGEILRNKDLITYSIDEEQFSCPFHGFDRRKSARYYKETDTAYCWVCTKKWDLFSWVAQEEEISFSEALNLLVKKFKIDISKLPDELEAKQKNHYKRTQSRSDPRKLNTEKISQAIHAIKNEVPFERYKKMTYAYMVLKYMSSDEKFPSAFEKLREAILRVIGETTNE